MPIRVLVVDDSAFMRKMLTEILSSDPDIQVVATARDGQDAVDRVKEFRPDVVTLDVEMPNMDGHTALKVIMQELPTPVVMVSSITQQGAEMTLKCLSDGAVDAIGKPSGSTSLDVTKISAEIVQKVKIASHANMKALVAVPSKPTIAPYRSRHPVRCLLLGASTGGPKALQTVLQGLPQDLPVPIVVVQHMPAHFTESFAQRLNSLCALEVKEAKPGDRLRPGQALIAPGGVHLTFDANGFVAISNAPPVHGVRPAIDVTIDSLVPIYGNSLLPVLLTGMGRDGAAGLKVIHDKGGHTIAEHESTCVVYGMPKTAFEMGAVEQCLPLHEIASAIVALVRLAPVKRIA